MSNKTSTLNLRVRDDTKERLRLLANDEDRTMTEYLERLIKTQYSKLVKRSQ